MGLGLTTCQMILERYGGPISASSLGEARGAPFRFVRQAVRPELPAQVTRQVRIEFCREVL
jgi:hypothetical protein